MFVLWFRQYATPLLPMPAIPYKRDGKAIVLLYSDKTTQLLRKRNLSFANIVFAAVFLGESDRKFLKNNKFFKPVFQKIVVKKRIRINFSPTHPFPSAILNKLLFTNWFATQFYHKPNNISSEICPFFEKYKNKSRINRCGLILQIENIIIRG